MRQHSRPAPAREHETRLEQRQVEAGAVEGDHAARALEQRGQRGEQRGLLVEVAHEVLRHHERVALDPAGPDEKRVGPGAPGQAGGLRVEEQEPLGREPVTLHARDAREDVERRAPDAVERHAAVAVGQRVFAAHDEQRSRAGVDDLAAHDTLDGLGGDPGRPARLDAPDDPPEIVQARHARQAVSARSSLAAVTLARRPTSFTGPTHEGQPNAQRQAASVSRPRRRRSGRISNTRSARPMPPACES